MYQLSYIFPILAILCVTNAIAAEKGVYFSGTLSSSFKNQSNTKFPDPQSNLSVSIKEEDPLSNVGGTTALGYSFENGLSIETEGGYRKVQLPIGSDDMSNGMTSLSLMLNGRYAYPVSTTISPYVGFGVGKMFIPSINSSAMAHQVMAGIEYAPVGKKGTWFGGYRYIETRDLSSPNLLGTAEGIREPVFRRIDLEENILEIGYRYRF